MQKKKQKQCNDNHFLDLSLSSLMGIWNAPTFNEWIWVSLIKFDPIQVLWVRSDPIQVLSVRSDPVRSSPVRSGPVRSWFCQRPIRDNNQSLFDWCFSAASHCLHDFEGSVNRWPLMRCIQTESRQSDFFPVYLLHVKLHLRSVNYLSLPQQ